MARLPELKKDWEDLKQIRSLPIEPDPPPPVGISMYMPEEVVGEDGITRKQLPPEAYPVPARVLDKLVEERVAAKREDDPDFEIKDQIDKLTARATKNGTIALSTHTQMLLNEKIGELLWKQARRKNVIKDEYTRAMARERHWYNSAEAHIELEQMQHGAPFRVVVSGHADLTYELWDTEKRENLGFVEEICREYGFTIDYMAVPAEDDEDTIRIRRKHTTKRVSQAELLEVVRQHGAMTQEELVNVLYADKDCTPTQRLAAVRTANKSVNNAVLAGRLESRAQMGTTKLLYALKGRFESGMDLRKQLSATPAEVVPLEGSLDRVPYEIMAKVSDRLKFYFGETLRHWEPAVWRDVAAELIQLAYTRTLLEKGDAE